MKLRRRKEEPELTVERFKELIKEKTEGVKRRTPNPFGDHNVLRTVRG